MVSAVAQPGGAEGPTGPPLMPPEGRPRPAAPAAPTRPVAVRRAHPARTARIVALVSSVAATFGVGLALARADRPAPTGEVGLAAGSPSTATTPTTPTTS